MFNLSRFVNIGATGGINECTDASLVQGKHSKYWTVLFYYKAKEETSCCKAQVASTVRLSVASMVADRFIRALCSSFTPSLGIKGLISHLHPESWGVPHILG